MRGDYVSKPVAKISKRRAQVSILANCLPSHERRITTCDHEHKQKHRDKLGQERESTDALHDQHAVAVAIEPVALFDGFLVGLQDQVAAGEGADQDQQGALG